MKRYVALLRGINVSGKNKIEMNALKNMFTAIGFLDVVTYLNSGNVAFSSDENNTKKLSRFLQDTIRKSFDLDIPVYVLSQEELQDIIAHAPEWWGTGNREIYDNFICLMSPLTYKEFHQAVGEPNESLEKVYPYKSVVFWSFLRKEYQKTNWWKKTSSVEIKKEITIRTANTIRRIMNK